MDNFTLKFVRKPRIGEIIVAENMFKQQTLIKRIVEVEGGSVDVYDRKTHTKKKVTIPKDHVWIEGDNKVLSRDSREFGPMPLCLVHGIVRARVWPLNQSKSF